MWAHKGSPHGSVDTPLPGNNLLLSGVSFSSTSFKGALDGALSFPDPWMHPDLHDQALRKCSLNCKTVPQTTGSLKSGGTPACSPQYPYYPPSTGPGVAGIVGWLDEGHPLCKA